METKAHHVLVGLFALILIAGGGIFAVWLGKVSFDEDYAFYDVVFEGPVRGLREAAEVRFNGIQVGEVTSLGLDGQSRVIARVRVLAQTPVRVDSFAQLEPQGLTGLSYILISGGSPDAQRLLSPASRQPPRIFARRAQLEGLVEGSEDVLDAAQLALFRLSELLNDQNVEEFSAMLVNLREITDQVNSNQVLIEDMRSAIQRIDTAASDISRSAISLQEFGVTAQDFVLNDLTPAVNETTAAAIAVNQAASDTTGLVQSIAPALDAFAQNGLEDMTLAAGSLNRLVDALERSAAQFENDPGGFVAGTPHQTVEVPQ